MSAEELRELVKERYAGGWDVPGLEVEILDLANGDALVTHGEGVSWHGAAFRVVYSGKLPERLQRLGFAMQGKSRQKVAEAVRAMYGQLMQGVP